jgi:hypothetical protein
MFAQAAKYGGKINVPLAKARVGLLFSRKIVGYNI